MSDQRPADRQPNRKNGNRPPAGNGAGGGMRFGKGLFGWVLFIALAVMLFMLLQKGTTQYAQIPLSEFTSRLEADKVAKLTIDSDKILGEFRGNGEAIGDKTVGKFQTALPAGASSTWEATQWILEHRGNAEVNVENSPNL